MKFFEDMKKDKELLKIRIFQLFILLAWTYIFVFFILKQTGVINTPVWITMSPYVAGFISIAALFFGMTEFFVRLKDLPMSHERLVKRVDKIGIGLTRVEKDVEYIKTDMNRSFDLVDHRFEQVDRRFEQANKRFERVEIRMDGLCKY